MSKLTVHISAGNRQGFGDFIKKCAAAGAPVPVVFAVDQDVAPDIGRLSPQTRIIFRHQPRQPGSDEGLDAPPTMYQGDPIAAADEWFDLCLPVWLANPAAYYAPINEQDPGDLGGYIWINAFVLRLIDRAEARGIHLAVYGMAAGNPRDDHDLPGGSTLEAKWAALVPSLQRAKAGGHVLLLHEYGLDRPAANGGPIGSLRASAPDLALRYRRSIRYLHQHNADPAVVISEAGPGVGATSFGADPWLADVAWYDAEVCKDRIVLAVCLYQLGGAENLADRLGILGDHIVGHPTPDPIGDPVVAEDGDPSPGDEDQTPRGAPRLQYDRIVYVPDGGTIADRRSVFDRMLADGRGEYSQSFDSAMIGDLASRRVVIFGAGPGRQTAIKQWRDLFYPGVILEFRPWPNEAADNGPTIDVPWLSQLTETAGYTRGDCGAACVAMLSAWKGHPVTVDQVSIATGRPPGYQALSTSEVVAVGSKFDLALQHKRPFYLEDIEREITAGRPVIALVAYDALPAVDRFDGSYHGGHYVIVTGINSTNVKYNDPLWPTAAGGANRTISRAAFTRALGTVATGNAYANQAIIIDATGADPTPAPGLAFVYGLGAGNPQPMTPAEVAALEAIKAPAVKLLTLGGEAEMLSTIAAVRRNVPTRLIMARAFFKPDYANRRRFDPVDFVTTVAGPLSAAYSAGVRWIELHNEPNLEAEGYGWNWVSGLTFGKWLADVIDLLRSRFPGLKLIYPGLSPQPNAIAFLDGSRSAIDKCDAIGAHCYWIHPGDGPGGMLSAEDGQYWRHVRSMFPGKPIIITEASNVNPGTDYATKGREYADFIKRLAAEPPATRPAGVFLFATTWPGQDVNREAFVDDRGRSTGIAQAMAAAGPLPITIDNPWGKA